MYRTSQFTLLLTLLILAVTLAAGAGPTSAAEGTSRQEGVVEHEVRDGDNLMLLAGYYYKDPRQWKKIFAANRSTITDPSLIHAGTILRVEADTARQWNISYTEYLSRVFD